MGEYQYYEFQAVDRPLTEREIHELRACSSRATITRTRFVNFYDWGDFKGSTSTWMEKYFDAFLYVADWGSHAFHLRLPRRVFDLRTARRYCRGESLTAREKGEFVVLQFDSEDEEENSGDDDGSGWLSSLMPLRADIARGDYRALYLAWLLCAERRELDDDDLEPPFPLGLKTLTAPLEALVDFLRIDRDLIAVAAERSPESREGTSSKAFERWIASLPDSEKSAFLARLATSNEALVRAELLRRFRETAGKRRPPRVEPRTVATLLAAAKRRTEERIEREAELVAQARARQEAEMAASREKYLERLAKREAETWRRVDELIATRRSSDYDQAVRLLRDLKELAAKKGRRVEADRRIRKLRERHTKKSSFLNRLGKLGTRG